MVERGEVLDHQIAPDGPESFQYRRDMGIAVEYEKIVDVGLRYIEAEGEFG